MKISTKGRYGLRILIDLATHDPEKPRMLKDIARSQQISEKYISRLVIDLRRAKLVRSVRGVYGGFHLAKLPEQITLLEVLETMEGPISVVDCVRSPEKCKRQTLCPARGIWMDLNNGIRELTSKITLDDILNAYRKHNAENGICDYCI
ncbi:MAG: Rrf2 family transcriptional regulator [Lentisphaeria bacterium]|nr:Rrf2 family transcriptional regulator [Lentisphaeria bacterium]